MRKMILVLLLMNVLLAKANSQTAQYIIGTNNDEMATHIQRLNDGSMVIAGYSYVNNGSTPTATDILLLKVDIAGNIQWQKIIESQSQLDDIVNDMIVTANGDIVIVGTIGRTGMFSDNTAFIMRFDSNTGGLIWQNYFHNPNTPNEVFWGVTETKRGRLVAVGAYSFSPGSNNGLICIYDAAGNLSDRQIVNSGGGEFYGVCRDVVGNNNIVYISGVNRGIVDGDGIVLAYDMSTSSISWLNTYDFTQEANRQNNFFDKIYTDANNKQLVVSTSSINGYSSFQNSHGILTMDINGGGEVLYDISNTVFGTPLPAPGMAANQTAIDIVDYDNIFTVQNPDFHPLWTTSLAKDAVITHIPSLSSKTIANKKYLYFENIYNRSIFDIDYNKNSNLLYMAGGTNNTTYYGRNNMFVYLTVNDLSDMNNCAITPNIDIQKIQYNVAHPNFYLNDPKYDEIFDITIADAQLSSSLSCGALPDQGFGSKLNTISTSSESESSFTLYPNPAIDLINISYNFSPNTKSANVMVVSVDGKILQNRTVSTLVKNIPLDVSEYANGVYYCILSIAGQTAMKQKFSIIR